MWQSELIENVEWSTDTVETLVVLPSVKCLGLTPLELAAYHAGIIELPEPKNTSAVIVFSSVISFH